MLKKSAKDTLAPALKFLIGIIRSSKKNIGGDSDLLRNEPLSRERCAVKECLLAQTVLTHPSQRAGLLDGWVVDRWERGDPRGGRASRPVVDLSWLAYRLTVHYQLAFCQVLRIHVNPSRGFCFSLFFVCFLVFGFCLFYWKTLCLLSQVRIIPQNLCLFYPFNNTSFTPAPRTCDARAGGQRSKVMLVLNQSLNSSPGKQGD